MRSLNEELYFPTLRTKNVEILFSFLDSAMFCTTTCFLQRKCNVKVTWLYERNLQKFKGYLLKWIHNIKIISSSYFEIYHFNHHHVFSELFRCSNLVIFSDLWKRKPISVIILPLKTFALVSCDWRRDWGKGKRSH